MGPTDAALIPPGFFFFCLTAGHTAPLVPLVWALSGRSQTRVHPPRPKNNRALAQEPEAAAPAGEGRGPISSEVRKRNAGMRARLPPRAHSAKVCRIRPSQDFCWWNFQ